MPSCVRPALGLLALALAALALAATYHDAALRHHAAVQTRLARAAAELHALRTPAPTTTTPTTRRSLLHSEPSVRVAESSWHSADTLEQEPTPPRQRPLPVADDPLAWREPAGSAKLDALLRAHGAHGGRVSAGAPVVGVRAEVLAGAVAPTAADAQALQPDAVVPTAANAQALQSDTATVTGDDSLSAARDSTVVAVPPSRPPTISNSASHTPTPSSSPPLSPLAAGWPCVRGCPLRGADVPVVSARVPPTSSHLDMLTSELLVSLDLFPKLTGPYEQVPRANRHLLVVNIGRDAAGSRLMDPARQLELFPLEHFQRIFFVYDDSDWTQWELYPHAIFVHVRAQMKWWYIKRFIVPAMTRAYAYIWFADEDVDYLFKPMDYLAALVRYDAPISSPSRVGHTSHHVTAQAEGAGRWTTFVECGPVVVISSRAWQCLYDIVVPSLTSGWGLDAVWCKAAAYGCGFGPHACAVLDPFAVEHANSHIAALKPGYSPAIEMIKYQEWLPAYWATSEPPMPGHSTLGPLECPDEPGGQVLPRRCQLKNV